MPGVVALRRSHGLQGMPASVAGVDAWGRPNAAEVLSDNHEGFREHGEWPKLALIAVTRKLVGRGDTSVRQNSLWQDAPAKTFRLPKESRLTTNTDAQPALEKTVSEYCCRQCYNTPWPSA